MMPLTVKQSDPPQSVSIVTFSDADWYREILWHTDADAAINVSGYSFVMKVRKRADDATVVLTMTTASGGGISILNAANGDIALEFFNVDLGRIAPGEYVHSLVAIRADGRRETMFNGSLIHSAGPSR